MGVLSLFTHPYKSSKHDLFILIFMPRFQNPNFIKPIQRHLLLINGAHGALKCEV